jgi:PAS domain S-box-containing protein
MPNGAEHTLVAAFLEQMPDLVCFKDRDHRCLAASRSLARRAGAGDPAQLRGCTDAELFSADYAEGSREQERTVMETGRSALDRVEPIRDAAGAVAWLRTSTLPLRDSAGELLGTVSISEDCTSAQETKLSLEQAQRDLLAAFRRAGMAEVAAGVLHAVDKALSEIDRSAGVIERRFQASPVESLGVLPDRLATDAGAPERLTALAAQLEAERLAVLAEVEALQQHIDQIKQTVSRQQAFARLRRPEEGT